MRSVVLGIHQGCWDPASESMMYVVEINSERLHPYVDTSEHYQRIKTF